MPPIAITDRSTWDNQLLQLPHPHVLQSWDWGEFKSRWGWQPTRWLWRDAAGRPAAAAQILRRPLPGTPWGMLYVPKGPVWDYSDSSRVEGVLNDLEALARRQRALFIKIDPDVPLAFGAGGERPHADGQRAQAILRRRGWRYSGQQIQFQNTVLIDLSPSEEELLAAMKSKWRYNIRLARRKGVRIRRGNDADLETFYRLYRITAERNRFLIRPRDYYLDAWRTFLHAEPLRAALLLACLGEQPIAGLMLFFFGGTAWYMYGASDNEHRNAMPNHLLQWEAMRLAKERGCLTYDMWGAPNTFAPSDSMWGVYTFKMGFGGVTQLGLGAYDYPVRPSMYRLYVRLLPRLLSLWRRV